MPSELSIEMRDQAARARDIGDERDAMAVATGSRIEQRIIDWLCEPLLQRIPARVHPNTISVVTHVIAWMTAATAVGSVHLPRPQRSLALVFAGVGMLMSMIGDSLDGMHARRTDQCSKLGEMMDHWLDAIIVPLTTIGITLALQMPMWAIALVNVTGAMVYHGQLVLYHHTGKFIHPEPATGMEAQLGLSVGYVGLAALYYFVDRSAPWLDMTIAAIAVFGIYIELRCNWFYYTRLGKLLRYHGIFVVMCGGFAALYLLRAIDLYAFVLALVCTSFRISGTYVLSTIVHRRFNGNDLGVIAWLVALFAAHFALPPIALGPLTLTGILPWAACAYMVARNLVDFSRHYRELKPTAAR
jgi:cardiolipin synthase